MKRKNSQKNKYNIMKSYSKNIRKKIFNPYYREYSVYEIELIKIIQKFYRIHFKKNIYKIILIQKFIRGWFTRKLLSEINEINNKLNRFFFIIKITIFYHHIHFNYTNARMKNYNGKLVFYFFKLQRYIKHFLLKKKIKKFLRSKSLNNLYIIYQVPKKIIKNNLRKKFNFFVRKICPLSKILMLQRNIKYFLKYKCRRQINKSNLNKLFYFEKIIKKYKLEKKVKSHLNKHTNNLLYKIANIKNNYITKKIISYHHLKIIQQNYKKHYNYLIYNYKIQKVKKISKVFLNKHQFISRIFKIEEIPKIILIQQKVKYFLYKINSNVNIIQKQYNLKCIFTKKIYFLNKNFKKEKIVEIIINLNNIIIKQIREYIFLLFFGRKIKSVTSFKNKSIFKLNNNNNNNNNSKKFLIKKHLTMKVIKNIYNDKQRLPVKKSATRKSQNTNININEPKIAYSTSMKKKKVTFSEKQFEDLNNFTLNEIKNKSRSKSNANILADKIKIAHRSVKLSEIPNLSINKIYRQKTRSKSLMKNQIYNFNIKI